MTIILQLLFHIIYKVLLQMGQSEKLITNPIIGNLKLKTLSRLTKKMLGPGFYYYFFQKGEKNTPPNNWTSFFSGSAWNYYEKEDIWALHLFSKKQMDLNWENPSLRDDLIKMINWWLDKGVDGFRMDGINYISKQPRLPAGDETIGSMMGYTGIEQYFYGPRLHEFLKQVRAEAFEPHGAFSVGKTPEEAFTTILAGTREHTRILLPWNFDNGNPATADYPEHLRQMPNADVTEVYKTLIRLRKENPALVYGDFIVLNKEEESFTYKRSYEGKSFIIDCNLSDAVQSSYTVPSDYKLIFPAKKTSPLGMLAPYEARIWAL